MNMSTHHTIAPGVDPNLHSGASHTWNSPSLWDHAASAYDEVIGNLSHNAAKRLVKLAHNRHALDLPGSGAIDLGAGTGSLTLALASNFPRIPILATDISTGMLRQLESCFSIRRLRQPRVTTKLLDMMHAASAPDGEPRSCFSHAFSTFALQGLSDPERALKEMYNLVRPGGCVALAIWDFEHECGPHAIWEKAATAANPKYINPSLRPPGKWISADELKAGLQSAGFVDIEVEIFKCHFQCVDGTKTFMSFFWESGNPMAAERITSYEGDLAKVKTEMESILGSDFDDGKKIFLDTVLAVGTKRA